MIVAMAAMWVMQMPCDQIIGVVGMGNGFLPLVVASTRDGDTRCRVERTLSKDMFLVPALLGVVQMALVQIIDVAFVAHAPMPALLVVDMRMPSMHGSAHRSSSSMVRNRFCFG
jgi:hypothetical protein